jgi:group I intron endonuclease
MDRIIAGVYQIKCTTTNNIYIGSSVNIERRLRQHFKELKELKHGNYKLQGDYNKYSLVSFETSILEEVSSKILRYELYTYEQKWLDCTSNKYNILNDAKAHLKTKVENKLRKASGLDPLPVKKKSKKKKKQLFIPIKQTQKSLDMIKRIADKKHESIDRKKRLTTTYDEILIRKNQRESNKRKYQPTLNAKQGCDI